MNLPGNRNDLQGLVMLSEAKDHLPPLGPRKKILRYAQDDKLVHFSPVLALTIFDDRDDTASVLTTSRMTLA
jgi:hypothetical protein